jgi:hypothetical protein
VGTQRKKIIMPTIRLVTDDEMRTIKSKDLSPIAALLHLFNVTAKPLPTTAALQD